MLSHFSLRKFRSQLSLMIVFIIGLVVGIFSWFTSKQETKILFDSIKRQGEALVQNIAIDSAEEVLNNDFASLEILLKQYLKIPNIIRARIINSDGLPLGDVILENGQVKANYSLTPVNTENKIGHLSYLKNEGKLLSVWEPIVIGKLVGYANIELSLDSIATVKKQLLLNTIFVGISTALLGLFLLFLYIRRPLNAIQQASEFAAKLHKKRGEAIVVESSALEFEQLSKALNYVSQKLFQQEQEVQATTERLKAILNHVNDGIITIDDKFLIQSFNPAAEKIFDYREVEIIGKPVQTLAETLIQLNTGQSKLKNKPITIRGSKKSGYSFPMEISAREVSLEGETFYTAIIRDVTEQVEYERALRNSEAKARKLALVASRTHNAVVITDNKARVEWANEGFSRITGYKLSEVIGKKPGDFLQGPETNSETINHMREQLSKGLGFKAELLNYNKAGNSYWVDIEVQPVFEEKNKTISNFIAVESDITDRKLAEAELLEAKEAAEKANAAKSEFLSRMSHELRTPLNAILGFAQLLELDPLNEEQTESVQRILKAGHHLLDLINEVLDIARIESGGIALSLEPVDLCRVVYEVVELVSPLADKRDITIKLCPTNQEEILVMADLQRLKQVLLNLLSNAVKYNHPKGSVEISLAENKIDNDLKLEIKDTGIGISSEKHERIFTAFDRLGAEQTEVEGSGIGLALTKHLINVMGGQIGFSSEKGKGSTFWFILPKAKQATSIEDTSNSKISSELLEASKVHTYTIVYIEDNLSNLFLVQRVLARAADFKLLTAMQGQIGLDIIREQDPDLVLLDLHLPGISGEEVFDNLKLNPNTANIPVVVVSADATPKTIKRLTDKGIDAYLTKPINVPELLTVIRSYLPLVEN